MIEWGQAPEFVEKKFRRSKSLHTKRYYEAGIRRFRQYCEEKHISEVNDESVYRVLDGFVGWLDLQGIKPKTLRGYVHAAKKLLLYLDVRIDAQRFREKVEQPRILKMAEKSGISTKYSWWKQLEGRVAGHTNRDTLDTGGQART